MKKNKALKLTLFAAAVCIFGSGCKQRVLTSEKPIVTVSIEPQRWLLERIVGDRMDVRVLMARGGNPESYEPAFSHLADLEKSSCYMRVGNLGFENAILNRISVSLPDLRIVNTSDSVSLIVDDHGHNHGVDPHVWSSTANARIMARNMLAAVSTLDPDGAEEYSRNFRALSQTIDSIDSICTSLLAAHRGETFIVWHPSLSYFARDYGLHQLSVGTEGKEHSVPDTRKVLELIGGEEARVFLVQKDFDTSKAASVAADFPQLKVVSINPLNYEWDTEILHTAEAIANR